MQPDVQNAIMAVFPPNQCLKALTVAGMAGKPLSQTSRALGCLVIRGLLERPGRACYQLTAAGLAHQQSGAAIASGPRRFYHPVRRRPSSIRQRIWRAAVLRPGKFTVSDLIARLARPGENERSLAALAREYLNGMVKAGFVSRCGTTARTGKTAGEILWRVDIDPGEAPMLHRSGAVTLPERSMIIRPDEMPVTAEMFPWEAL